MVGSRTSSHPLSLSYLWYPVLLIKQKGESLVVVVVCGCLTVPSFS